MNSEPDLPILVPQGEELQISCNRYPAGLRIFFKPFRNNTFQVLTVPGRVPSDTLLTVKGLDHSQSGKYYCYGDTDGEKKVLSHVEVIVYGNSRVLVL